MIWYWFIELEHHHDYTDENDDGESPAGNRMIIHILIAVPKIFATCAGNYFLSYSVIKQN